MTPPSPPQSPPPPAPPIRRLDLADLDACLALCADRGWPREHRTWPLLLELGEVHGIDGPAGRLAGTVAWTRYGPGLSTVSMTVVAREHAGHGLGTALMRHALRANGRSDVSLHATDLSRPLYLRLGFRSTGWCRSYLGVPAVRPSGRTRPAGPADLAAVALADQRAFGADRSALLRAWAGADPHRWLRVAERDGELCGHAGAWRSTDELTLLGPVVADDPATAIALLGDLAADAGGPVRVDIDPALPDLESWALASGLLARQRPFPLMTLDGAKLPGDRSRVHAPVGTVFG